MKRILFVANNLDVGGPQKGLLALLDVLDPTAFDCTVVSLQRDGDLRGHFESRAKVLDVDDTTFALQINRSSVALGLRALLRRGWFYPSVLYVVAVAMRVTGRAMNPWRQRLWAASSRRLSPVPGEFDAAVAVSAGLATYFVVDCVRAPRKYHWVIGDYSRTAIDHEIDLSYFEQTSAGLAVSMECAEIFRSVFPELKQQILPFHQLIPWKFYEEQAGLAPEFAGADGLRVLTVSRLDPGKGLEMAVEACSQLLQAGRDVRWVVLGDGSFREGLEKLIDEFGVREHIILAGFRTNVMDYISATDVFVLPSRSEGRSSAVDEALAAGTPVVVTNYRTAASQVAHDETGLICEMNAESIARAVDAFFDPDTKSRLTRNTGRDRASEALAANELFRRLADA